MRRSGPPKRKKALKRTGLSRKRKQPKLKTVAQIEKENKRLFREAARAQKLCQGPDCPNRRADWQAHHVVYEQHLREHGHPIYDARNAMRLCELCHTRHHRRVSGHVISTKLLPAAAIAYAFDLLGPVAASYLRRYYDDADADPRIQTEWEALSDQRSA